jgi:hypothetical protein
MGSHGAPPSTPRDRIATPACDTNKPQRFEESTLPGESNCPRRGKTCDPAVWGRRRSREDNFPGGRELKGRVGSQGGSWERNWEGRGQQAKRRDVLPSVDPVPYPLSIAPGIDEGNALPRALHMDDTAQRDSAADQTADAFELFAVVEIDDDLAPLGALHLDQHGGSEAVMELFLELDDVGRLA